MKFNLYVKILMVKSLSPFVIGEDFNNKTYLQMRFSALPPKISL